MYRIAIESLHKQAVSFTLALSMVATAFAQAPTPAPSPAGAMQLAPLATPAAAATDTSMQAFEPVRQAIARQDYTTARQALDAIKQANPSLPGIALYENMIERRQTQGQTLGAQSPLRTPRAGVTPAPTPVPTPTPAVTPAPTPAPVATPVPSATDGVMKKVNELKKNPIAFYGAIGALALIIGLIIWALLRRRRSAATEPSGNAFSEPANNYGMDSYGLGQSATGDSFGLGTGAGLSTSPLSTDYTPSSPAVGAYGDTDSSAGGAGSALGGSALGGSMGGFAMPSFTADQEEETPPPKPVARPKPVEDDGPVNIFNEEPHSFGQTPAPSALSAEPVAPAPSLHHALPDDDTVMLSKNTGLSNTTPTSTPSITPGNVDLEDIFGSQPLPGANEPLMSVPAAAPADSTDDLNNMTLPTFVSSPGSENPETAMETPPPAQQRRTTQPESDTQSISFDELFGSAEESALTPAPEPEPAPAADLPPARAMGDVSLEDALAATLNDMQADQPFDEQPTIMSAPEEDEPASSESLDERSERMFREQMDKARSAVEEKNWRQAVHFLSIASALHPENEEAKLMLKEARAEKRKAEESV